MEVVEVTTKHVQPTYRSNNPGKLKRKYVQPPRGESFAPRRKYCPPSNPIDSKTTYDLSFLTKNEYTRLKPILPSHSLSLGDGKIVDDTTTKMSYIPVWNIIKPKPIIPRRRTLIERRPMECTTTSHQDFVKKYCKRTEQIMPRGQIRRSSGPLESKTTTHLSYMKPGRVQKTMNFKPQTKYCPPSEPLPSDTIQKLSYRPQQAPKREIYPWAMKPLYRPPSTKMFAETTYGKSFLENSCVPRQGPILPDKRTLFPRGAEFLDRTIYKESFIPCSGEVVGPILPSSNITLSDQKMVSETTTKLSYLPVYGEKRNPILPRRRKMIGDGPMQSVTTAHSDFVSKKINRTQMIMPRGHIRTSDKPIEATTTAALSYMNPTFIPQIRSFKPISVYKKPEEKVASETVTHLSYQQWQTQPKEDFPWARKKQYEPPKNAMAGDTVYHLTYPTPGYFIEECESD